MICSHLPNNLRHYRICKNMSQQNLANQLYIARQTYNHYEKGKRMPPLETLIRIAELLEVSIDELFEENPKYKDSSDSPKPP